MSDSPTCPICDDKLKIIHHKDFYLCFLDKTEDYIERFCSTGCNHFYNCFVNSITKNIDYLKISLNSKYSEFFEMDYLNKKSRVVLYKKTTRKFIDIPRLIEPDFPLLIDLKDKLSFYVTFS